jgi:hypothetical protein
MASKVKIANLALSRLGVSAITSLTDNTIEAKQANLMFEEVAKEVMTEGAFSSTIRRAVLNLTANTPDFGFTYEFQLPTNPVSLRILSIDEEQTGSYEYRIEGDKLLANISTMEVEYIAYLTNSGDYDEMLKRVIVAKLAAELAYPLTGSGAVADKLYNKYLQEFADAKSVDGQNGSNLNIISTDLTDIR